VFAHHELRVGIGVAVTERHGGVSQPPWASLNLADHVGDNASAVTANRQRLVEALGHGVDALVGMHQVHGAAVAVVAEAPSEPPTADALVTRTRGIALLVLVADCTPILLSDRRAGVIGAVHAGRRGLASGVLPAALAEMARHGARPERTYAVVGPGICPDHYEVPAKMRDDVAAAAPGSDAVTRSGSPALDIRAGLLRQLHTAGVRQQVVLPQCTAEDDRFFSHRRDGVTGRFGAVVWMTP
jgi:purine-nucleoside/S-methyl-5'-thioadenosine phosphorylase / adenosine deaminase